MRWLASTLGLLTAAFCGLGCGGDEGEAALHRRGASGVAARGIDHRWLAAPLQHEAEGMDQLSLPASDNFSWDGHPETSTRILVQNPMIGVVAASRHGKLITLGYAQEMVAHCFSTLLSGGSCEIIDTDFVSH